MNVPMELKNLAMLEKDVIELSSRDLDAAQVDIALQPSPDLQKTAIADRLQALVTNPGRVSSFRTALNTWKIEGRLPALSPGKHTLQITIKHNGNKSTLGGHVTANFYAVPVKPNPAVMVDHGMVHPSAVNEIGRLTPGMIQALKMVFNKTATGRSAPGTTNVNHIHVGGNAQENLLFHVAPGNGPYVVLGVVNGHIDRSAPPAIRALAQTITMRAGQAANQMRVNGAALV